MRKEIFIIVLLNVLGLGHAFMGNKIRFPLKTRLDLVNPNYTDITNYPYTVAVLKGNKLMGGGVIVAKQWVLTAAYNTDGFLASTLKVRIGSNNPTSGGRQYKVTRKIQHTKYYGNWTYDLSLLRLGAPINLKIAQVITLASSMYQGSGSAVITGFGATHKLMGIGKTQMQVASLQMYDAKTCDQSWYGSELSEGEICGFAPAVGPCWSDFGDPVADCTGDTCTLVGIFAGSYGCADDHYPGIYMDIGFFHDWIVNNTRTKN